MTTPDPHPPESSAQRRAPGSHSSMLPLLLLLPVLAVTVALPVVSTPLSLLRVIPFLLTELVLAALLIRAVHRMPRPFRAGWLLVFLAVAFVMAAATMWILTPFQGGFGLPEILYFCSGLLVWGATLQLQHASGSPQTGSRLWLIDVLVVTISVATLSWYFLIRPDQTQSGGNVTAFSQVMPLMDVSLLALTAWLLLRPHTTYPRPLFAVALLLSVFSNTSLHLVVEGLLPFNSVGPFLWLLATALLAIEARRPLPRIERRAVPRSGLNHPWANTLPYVALAVLAVLQLSAVSSPEAEPDMEVLNIVTLAVFGLLILRQLLTLAENRKLTDSLLRANAELHHLAYHDALTGLPNRAAFEQQSREAFERGTLTGVMFLDLDGFKSVNDELGHDAGDELLRQLAGRLVTAVPEGATVSRLGGDEFLIHFDGVHMSSDIAAGIRTAAEVPYQIGGQRRRISLSIGMSDAANQDGPASLRHQADLAMYRAKQRAKTGLA